MHSHGDENSHAGTADVHGSLNQLLRTTGDGNKKTLAHNRCRTLAVRKHEGFVFLDTRPNKEFPCLLLTRAVFRDYTTHPFNDALFHAKGRIAPSTTTHGGLAWFIGLSDREAATVLNILYRDD